MTVGEVAKKIGIHPNCLSAHLHDGRMVGAKTAQKNSGLSRSPRQLAQICPHIRPRITPDFTPYPFIGKKYGFVKQKC